MSALRLESPRLVWLETFIQVANAENISAAARNMNVDQSTISRQLQLLQKWLGKALVDPGRVSDPEDPGVNVGLTEAGREFFELAERVVADLQSARTEDAKREEILDAMEKMIERMLADLDGKRPSLTARKVSDQIRLQARVVGQLRSGAPLDMVESLNRELRRFVMRYESELKWEQRKERAAKSSAKVRKPQKVDGAD